MTEPAPREVRFIRQLCLSGLTAAVFAASVATCDAAATALSDNDVSWLFPAPHSTADLANLIAMKDLKDPNGRQVWSPATFQAFVTLAEADSFVSETNSRIGLPTDAPDAHTIDAWFVAGVRFDPGAPGLSKPIADQFGQLPEIRLIVQPVSITGTSVKVNDYAAHLIFDFVRGADKPVQPGCGPHFVPDTDAFNSILNDIVALRDRLASGAVGGTPVVTAGQLGVHPAFSTAATAAAVVPEMKKILEDHLSPERLDAMSVVGTPSNAPAPWMFLSMLAPPGSPFGPVPSPTLDGTHFALALDHPEGAPLRVLPRPFTNNGVVATCRSGASPIPLPMTIRHGVSTADLFPQNPVSPDEVLAVTATIADPERSHFFNTDCASCHTETRLLSHQNINPIRLDPNVLPTGDWVVRNFGWSPTGKRPAQATATRRTEMETHAIVEVLNAQNHSP
jgi:hypothetical protein